MATKKKKTKTAKKTTVKRPKKTRAQAPRVPTCPRQVWVIVNQRNQLLGSFPSQRAAFEDLRPGERVVGPYALTERRRNE